jgi:hypothetical protein
LKLNRTLGEHPAARLADSAATPKEKHSLLFCFDGGEFLFKKERTFSFRGSALQVFEQYGGAKCGRGKAKLFLREECAAGNMDEH